MLGCRLQPQPSEHLNGRYEFFSAEVRTVRDQQLKSDALSDPVALVSVHPYYPINISASPQVRPTAVGKPLSSSSNQHTFKSLGTKVLKNIKLQTKRTQSILNKVKSKDIFWPFFHKLAKCSEIKPKHLRPAVVKTLRYLLFYHRQLVLKPVLGNGLVQVNI